MIVIRNATQKDVGLITEFNQSMALETENKILDGKVLEQGVRNVFEKSELGFYLIAEYEGAAAASLMITTEWSDWRNGIFWWIQSVYVNKEYRRKGLFKALYGEVKKRAKESKGICGIRLYVEQDNETAQKTYQSLGMIETDYRLYEEEF